MRYCLLRTVYCLLLAGLVAACAPAATPLDVRLSDLVIPTPAGPSALPAQPTLRLAVAAVNSPRGTLDTYQELVDYLAARLNISGQLIQGKTYAEINDLVRDGDATLAIVCANPYVEGQEDFGMEALAVPQVGGTATYYSYLIVPTSSTATRLDDLRGKTFAFADPLSNSGRLVIVYQLALQGQTSDAFFRRYIFTYSHDNSIKAVADGLVDGAAVDSLVYDYLAATDPARTAKTRIIVRYGPFGSGPVVVHPRLDASLKERLHKLLLEMHQDPAGAAILSRLHWERLATPDDKSYDPVRQMRQKVKGK